MRKIIVILIFLGIVGGAAGFWYWKATANRAPNYRMAQVTRGRLEAVIGATGTLEPEEVIDVGAQVAGRILRFGTDVDYNSEVEPNAVLAEIDDALYVARRDSAKADLEKAKADKEQNEAKLKQAERDLDRARALFLRKAIAQADLDSAQATYDSSKAAVAVSDAQILQAKSALNEAETNLSYTTIRSPVKGVIIDRRVNVGQTVVASLQAPSLFLIAKDLTKMQIWVSVNEADIGQIKIDQAVRFTVDALPGKSFEGKVLKQGKFSARLNASMTQNVVTYTVVITTDNSSGDLLPYWTANVKFIVSDRKDVLLVPNSALRYRPKIEQVAPDVRDLLSGKRKDAAKEAAAKEAKEAGAKDKKGERKADGEQHEHGTVWVKDGDYLRPVRVRIGYTDGLNTEILGGDLEENMEVVIGEGRNAPVGSADANPFAPAIFGKGKKN